MTSSNLNHLQSQAGAILARPSHRARRAAVLCPLLFMFLLASAWAQAPQPTSISYNPTTVSQGQCYTMTVGNGAYMTLDMQYKLNGGSVETIYGWPSLDSNGQAYICTSAGTPLGLYETLAIKNTLNSSWVPVYATITVTGPPDFTLSITPTFRSIDQGGWTQYSVSVLPVNGFNSTVSLSVGGLPAAGESWFNNNPIWAGSSTMMNVATSSTSPSGTYILTVQGASGSLIRSQSVQLIVNPRQPTSVSFSPSQGYAGNDCYTLTVGNGANMTVDFQYQLNGVPQPVWSVTLNSNGQWSYCLNHYDTLGTYRITVMKNQLRSDWVNVSPPVSHTVLPPQPTWLTISPSSVTAGQGSYRMTAGNSAAVTLDVQYRINGGPTHTVYGWPSLAATYPGSANGQADIWPAVCTACGAYVYTAVKNTLNGAWAPVSASVTINPPAAPAITSVAPASGMRGANVAVTITGSRMCGAALSTGWAGLTFSNVNVNGSGTSVTAIFTVSPTATLGTATVTLSASGGPTTFNFVIVSPPTTLKKEYIYINGRLVVIEVP